MGEAPFKPTTTTTTTSSDPDDDGHNTSNNLQHHQVSISIEEKNKQALEFIDHVTTNADEIQKRVLSEILTRNADVEYLKRYDFDGRTADREIFKKILPVVTYEDVASDIERIANGDKSHILCSHNITEFLTSSGTSGGERKLIPTIDEELDRRTLLYSLLMPIMSQFVEGLDQGKGMYFLFIKTEAVTPGGLPARPVLTSYYKSRHFKTRPSAIKDQYTNYTSPTEAILCLDSFQSMYSQVLCGLSQRESVVRVGAVFASGFIRAIKFLETYWTSLCHDLRVGSPDEGIVTDPVVREAVIRVLGKPDPELAGFVEGECRKESWKGIIKRLWPNTKYIEVVVTGTMGQYIPTLDYYSDELPLVCTMYASSECYFGVNLNPMCKPSEVCYTLIPNMAYFEFLPVIDEGKSDDGGGESSGNGGGDKSNQLVDLVDVELGKEYELVLTTYAGLYRYRVGDILRVSGFKNKAPQFKFIRRKNVALSIDSDKTDEVELQNAVKNAVTHLHSHASSSTLVEYTSYADTSVIPGHYVLFWEINTTAAAPSSPATTSGAPVLVSPPPSAAVMEQCCLIIEESLNSVYRQCRTSDKSIAPLEIRVVETGTFDKLMDYALSIGASINQYKTPRCVKYAPIIELLNSRVVDKYFSPKCPKWVPGHKQWHA